MTAKLFSLPKQTPFTNAGALIPGAKLYFYTQGTSTPANVYTTSALAVAHASPVVADGNGIFAAIYLDATVSYKVKMTDASGVEIYTEDAFELADSATVYMSDLVDDTTPTLGGNLDCSDLEVQRAELKDISATKTSPTISSGVIDFNMENGNVFDVTLTENITSITFTNWPATGNYGWCKVRFKQDATGSRTVTGWPAAVDWIGGAAPTITTTASTGKDWLEFTTMDAGTEIDGHYGQDYS